MLTSTLLSFICLINGILSEDPCKFEIPGRKYGIATSNCGAYLVCVNGASVLVCCPPGTSFVQGFGCVPDSRCRQECRFQGGLEISEQIPVCSKTGDIIFFWDMFEYMKSSDFILLKDFVADVIGAFEIGTDAISADMLVNGTLLGDTVGLDPKVPEQSLKNLVRNLQHPNVSTDTAQDIEAARGIIRQQGQKNRTALFVVITDEWSNNRENIITQANLTKASGIQILAVGIETVNFTEELNEIASEPSHVIQVANYTALQGIVASTSKLICAFLTPASTTTLVISTTTTTASTLSILPYTEQQTRVSSSEDYRR